MQLIHYRIGNMSIYQHDCVSDTVEGDESPRAVQVQESNNTLPPNGDNKMIILWSEDRPLGVLGWFDDNAHRQIRVFDVPNIRPLTPGIGIAMLQRLNVAAIHQVIDSRVRMANNRAIALHTFADTVDSRHFVQSGCVGVSFHQNVGLFSISATMWYDFKTGSSTLSAFDMKHEYFLHSTKDINVIQTHSNRYRVTLSMVDSICYVHGIYGGYFEFNVVFHLDIAMKVMNCDPLQRRYCLNVDFVNGPFSIKNTTITVSNIVDEYMMSKFIVSDCISTECGVYNHDDIISVIFDQFLPNYQWTKQHCFPSTRLNRQIVHCLAESGDVGSESVQLRLKYESEGQTHVANDCNLQGIGIDIYIHAPFVDEINWLRTNCPDLLVWLNDHNIDTETLSAVWTVETSQKFKDLRTLFDVASVFGEDIEVNARLLLDEHVHDGDIAMILAEWVHVPLPDFDLFSVCKLDFM